MTTATDTTPDEATATGRPKAKVLADVRRTAKAIAAAEAKRDELYDRRRDLILEARGLDDKATQRELAEAAGVSETVIINTIKKAEATDG